MNGVADGFICRHKLRLDISSSNFPRLDVNPNSGEPVGRHTRAVVATNTVYTGEEKRSRLVLPVVPLAPTTARACM